MTPQLRRTAAPQASTLLNLRVPALAALPWLVHGFSTRFGGASRTPGRASRGELNLGYTPWDEPALVELNRTRFLESLRAARMRQVVQHQIHSDLLRALSVSPPPGQPLRGDGLLTSQPSLLLSIISADCFAVLLVDVRQRAVAALHCGWRGTLLRMAQKAVGAMRQEFGSRPADLLAAIGPGIGVCCYDVGEEIVSEYESQFVYAGQLFEIRQRQQTNVERKYATVFRSPFRPLAPLTPCTIRLNLLEANHRQLLDAGLSARQIFAGLPCTHCRPDLFFSHRRDGSRSGRMMGVIGIRGRPRAD